MYHPINTLIIYIITIINIFYSKIEYETDETGFGTAKDFLAIWPNDICMYQLYLDVYKNAYKFIYTNMYSNKMEVQYIQFAQIHLILSVLLLKLYLCN